jgi:hypothetical protein
MSRPPYGLLLLLPVLAVICIDFCSANVLECGMVSIWNTEGFPDCEAASFVWRQRARLRRQNYRNENRPEVTILSSSVHLSHPPLQNRRFCARTRRGTALAMWR